MKLVVRIIGLILFVLFFLFALKNTQETELKFLVYEIYRGPLVILLLFFFVGGVAMGILAMTPTFFRQRRDLSRQKKALATIQKESEVQQQLREQPPQPDIVVNAAPR
jgi:putative membrane protein